MNPELNSLIAAVRSAAADAKMMFGSLNAEQLNWQPNANSWSVGLCLEHLIKTNNELLASIEKHIFVQTPQKTIFERLALGSNYFGNYILKATQPENRKKVKAPQVFRPTTSHVDENIVEKFVKNQEKVVAIMEASSDLDLDKTIITSPVAPFITYSLWHAFKIIVTHERRHFRQAQNVIETNGFPK